MRFVTAQDAVYKTVIEELSSGRKRSHWIWFVFPQVDGLGRSPTAKHYAIGSRREAVAYASHPLLGMRLRECTELTPTHTDRTAHQIFGSPDDMKFRSSMTLFDAVGGRPLFRSAIDRFYAGEPDHAVGLAACVGLAAPASAQQDKKTDDLKPADPDTGESTNKHPAENQTVKQAHRRLMNDTAKTNSK